MADNRVNVRLTADDQATEKVERLQKQTDQTTQSMRQMARSMLAGALAGFSFQYALSAIDQRVTEIDANQERTAFIVSLMPENIQQAYLRMKPHFGSIANEFGFMADDAETAYGAIVSQSEGVIPSQKHLAAVFAISALTGKSVEEVGIAMGKALAGNIQPIQDLSGTHESLNTIMAESTELAKEEFDRWDQLKFLYRQVKDAVALAFKEFVLFATSGIFPFIQSLLDPVGTFLDFLVEQMLPLLTRLKDNVINGLKDALNDVKDAVQGLADKVFTVIGPVGTFIKDNFVGPLEDAWNWIQDIIGSLPEIKLPNLPNWNPFASNTSSSGGASVTVNVMNPVVDNDVRQAELSRQIADQLRLITRSGGVFT